MRETSMMEELLRLLRKSVVTVQANELSKTGPRYQYLDSVIATVDDLRRRIEAFCDGDIR